MQYSHLQPLVVGRGRPVYHLLLPPRGPLAADAHLRLQLLQLLRVHGDLVSEGGWGFLEVWAVAVGKLQMYNEEKMVNTVCCVR